MASSSLRRFIDRTLAYPFDWVGPAVMLLLGLMGVSAIHSAESYVGGHRWLAQLVWLSAGAAVYLGVSLINYKIILEKAHLIFAISIIPLLLLWTPLGERHYGALRWLNLGFITIQPSEIAKIGALVLGASLLARSKIGNFKDSLSVLSRFAFVFLLPTLLIFLQPDLGSALVLQPMAFSLLYIARLSSRFFLAAFGVFIVILGLLGWDAYSYCKFLEENELNPVHNPGLYEKTTWVPLKDYQRNRILAFIAPEVVDPQGVGVSWNLRQSLIAVGSGGLIGKGDGEGTQAKLGYLPQSVAPNDFIFSVLAEERGFLGGAFVIILFAILTCNGIRIAGLAKDRFGLLLCVGSSVIFAVHAFINIGMTIGLMPITGLPLPFLSYGGSFVLSCCILQGIIQSVYRFRKDYS